MIPHKTIDEIKARIIIRMSQTSPKNEQNPRKLKAELRKNARSRHKEKRDFQGSIPRAKPSTSNDLRTATPPPPLCKPRRRKGGRGEDVSSDAPRVHPCVGGGGGFDFRETHKGSGPLTCRVYAPFYRGVMVLAIFWPAIETLRRDFYRATLAIARRRA